MLAAVRIAAVQTAARIRIVMGHLRTAQQREPQAVFRAVQREYIRADNRQFLLRVQRDHRPVADGAFRAVLRTVDMGAWDAVRPHIAACFNRHD